MKKIFITIMICLLFIPFNVKADEKKYETLNLTEALKDEEIAQEFDNYSENDNQITIYLFRGKGCGYCRKFLTFLNSITEEYGKYFKLESYEVWYNQDNASLMEGVSKYLNKEAGGVPYIIIGDKVFAGYSESYDEDIKNQIKKLYETKKSNRYDAIKEYTKNNGENKDKNSSSSFSIVAFNVIFTIAIVAAVAVYDSKKRLDLENRISKLEGKKAKKNEN